MCAYSSSVQAVSDKDASIHVYMPFDSKVKLTWLSAFFLWQDYVNDDLDEFQGDGMGSVSGKSPEEYRGEQIVRATCSLATLLNTVLFIDIASLVLLHANDSLFFIFAGSALLGRCNWSLFCKTFECWVRLRAQERIIWCLLSRNPKWIRYYLGKEGISFSIKKITREILYFKLKLTSLSFIQVRWTCMVCWGE